MKWLIQEIVGPIARRVGGQTSAALVGAGMAAEHESAVAAVAAWAVLSGAEVAFSHFNKNRIRRETARKLGIK